MGNDILLKTNDKVAIKEYRYSKAGFLVTLCSFQNTSPSRISVLVCYWAGNNILHGVYLIHSGINL